MSNQSSKSLNLAFSAIKNLKERRGSSYRHILNYISSLCNVPRDSVKRQVLTALKRGTIYGILRETDGYYSLPSDTSSICPEIASQELGLLDLSCRKRKQQARKRKKSKKSSGRSERLASRRQRSRKSRRRKKKNRSKYNCSMVSRRSRRSNECGTKKRRRRRRKSQKGCACPPKTKPIS